MGKHVSIINDIDAIADYVEKIDYDLSQQFLILLRSAMNEITERGIDDVCVMFSNEHKSVFFQEDPGHLADHEFLYLHVLIMGINNQLVVDKFITIDVTGQEVHDCSSNIVTRH